MAETGRTRRWVPLPQDVGSSTNRQQRLNTTGVRLYTAALALAGRTELALKGVLHLAPRGGSKRIRHYLTVRLI